MTIGLLIFAIIGVSLIFAAAAWFGPKMIRAFYPEEMHERMYRLHRNMVIIAIVVGIVGFIAGIGPFLAMN